MSTPGYAQFPDRLRVVDGELVLADGGDVREYLRDWAARNDVTGDTPVTLIERACISRLYFYATLPLVG